MIPLHFDIPEAPVAKGRPRVDSRGGRPRTFTPARTELAEWRIREHVRAQLGDGWQPLTGPLRLEVDVTLPMPKSIPRSKRETALPTKRPDIDNYAKLVLDALRDVWVDDAQVVSLEVRKFYAIPADDDGCALGRVGWEITVSEASA